MSNRLNIHSSRSEQPSLVGLDTARGGNSNIFNTMKIDKEEIWKCLSLEDLEVEIDGETIHEIWKDVTGYEGYYQISNLGRLKSLGRKIDIRRNNDNFDKRLKTKIISQFRRKSGYKRVTVIISKDGSIKSMAVSMLVANAYIQNPLNKPLTCHKNDIPWHNWESNLWWGTAKENTQDMMSKNRACVGEKNSGTKLTNKDKISIVVMINNKVKYKVIADLFNISVSTVEKIKYNNKYGK